jgi:DNA polymerase-3 subunit gamma/tau
MADQALYRKWRPAAFDEVVGQEHIVQTIQNALASGRAAHAYLFSGPRGTGKTTTARLVAKALNCTHTESHQRPCNTCDNCVAVNEGRFLDLIEIDAASNTGVDNIRDLRDKINFSPSDGQYKIYIIDEVHMLSMGAFNALLKTLEEPPPHAIFILATTEIHKVPATVASRCQKHTFRRIPLTEMVSRLSTIATREKLHVESSVLEVIARQATGSLRDAISLLDQLVISPDEKVTLDSALVLLGAAGTGAVQDIIGALAERDSAHGLELLNSAIDNGIDPRQLARQLVDYLRGLLLIKLGNPTLVDATSETRKVMQAQAAQFDPGLLIRAIRSFNGAANEARGGWLSQLPLELAFVESLRLPTTAAEAVQPATASAPAKATPAPAAAPPRIESASAPNDPHLDKVISRWKDIRVASKKYHASLPALLERCVPVKMEGDLVVLGFQTKVLLTKADTPSNLDGIAKAIYDVLGISVKARCVLNSGEMETLPDVPSNSVVAEAVRLGGKIQKG